MAPTNAHTPAKILHDIVIIHHDLIFSRFFEFSEPGSLDHDKIAEQFKTYLEEYQPKSSALRIRYDNHSYCFCTDSFLTSKCGACIENGLPAKCTDCQKQDKRLTCPERWKRDCPISCDFTRQIQITLPLKSDYACLDNKQEVDNSSVCFTCRYMPQNDTPYGLGRKITIHDIRFYGHPVSLQLLYAEHRCGPKKELLKFLPGIYRGSGSNQIRCSTRLAKKINAALVDGIPRDYIAEAASISYNSVRSWLRREKEKMEKAVRKGQSHYSFIRSKEFEIQISTPIKIGNADFIICLQREADRSAAITGIYPVEEWRALEALFAGDLKKGDKNLFLRRTYSHLDECFLYSDMLFNYLAAYCPIAPSIFTYIATRLLAEYFHYGMVSFPDVPHEYQEFYETCWYSFRNSFDLDANGNDPQHRYLELFRVFSNTAETALPDEYRKLKICYHELEEKAREIQLHCVQPRADFLTKIDLSELGECAATATVKKTDIPVLLQYYNPVVAPHKENKTPSFKYCFDDGGDFDFGDYSIPVPGISLEDTVELIKAGILIEMRTETEPLSISLMNGIKITL